MRRAVNIEAQLCTETSLLRGLQRLIAVGNQHSVFGCGFYWFRLTGQAAQKT
jgi:hypothetical protein